MMKGWNSTIYSFYKPTPDIEHIGTEPVRRCHTFTCAKGGCKTKIRCYLDKGDRSATGNLRKHAKSCWGEASYSQVIDLKDVAIGRKAIGELSQTGTITAAFERKGQGKITFLSRQFNQTETR